LERSAGRRYPRRAELEPRFATLSPELRLGVDPHQFAAIAAVALQPKPEPVVGIDHVHAARVSVREHMAVMRERLARSGSATFRALVADCRSTLEVVARFLGLLELYREGDIAFDQAAALAELRVRWTGGTPQADAAAWSQTEDQNDDQREPSDPDEEYA
jgi:segregation and condensation protein A